jgi:uncharacterized membrane protein YdjX (TVP38/TMEM64 family)
VVSALVMVAEILFLPSTLLTVAAGFAFKKSYKSHEFSIFVGTVSGWVGISLGAIITMALGRFVFQEQARKLANKYPLFEAVDKAVQERGVTLLILLRLCPVIPFTPVNFFFGATEIPFKHFCLGLLAVLPSTAAHVFLGTTLSDIQDAVNGKTNWSDNIALLVLCIIGTALAILAIVWVSWLTKKHLQDIIEKQLIDGRDSRSTIEERATAEPEADESTNLIRNDT